ncbi:hypothetical protein [Streptomyces sp. AN091965]|uniref:hypothetical protein n=1 Tax=Streptomyces sp. AN091965 TaxID=2927803 RepID=UPI001F6100E3|nr:hypothetical protein [Streptomyces sp. AN091965]MCI3933224.1 hypothetical protein [Streptomyces sp. AN091965]
MIPSRTPARAARRGASLFTAALAVTVALGTLATGAVAQPRPDAPRATPSMASHPGPPKSVQPKKGSNKVPTLPSAPLKGLPTLQEAKKKGLIAGPVKSRGGVKLRSFPEANCSEPPQGSGYHDYLKPGECLTPGKYIAAYIHTLMWYELWVQDDGNVVLYKNDTWYKPVWQTNTRGWNVSLWMQRDGNVVVYDAQGNPLWHLGTHGCGDWGAWLRVQSDANLVLYDRNWGPLWARFNGPSTRPC